MSDAIRLELAGAPQGKGRGRAAVTKGGFVHVYTPQKTATYEAQLRHAATQVMAGRPPLDGPVALTMWLRFPIPASWSKKKREQALRNEIFPTVKPDADNSLKLTDALNFVCFQDDKQIVDARVIKRYSDTPGMTIDIRSVVTEAKADDLSTVDRYRLPLFYKS